MALWPIRPLVIVLAKCDIFISFNNIPSDIFSYRLGMLRSESLVMSFIMCCESSPVVFFQLSLSWYFVNLCNRRRCLSLCIKDPRFVYRAHLCFDFQFSSLRLQSNAVAAKRTDQCKCSSSIGWSVFSIQFSLVTVAADLQASSFARWHRICAVEEPQLSESKKKWKNTSWTIAGMGGFYGRLPVTSCHNHRN